MLDFMRIATKDLKGGIKEVYPEFILYKPGTVQPCCDIMVRAGDFYAIWNEDTHLWSTVEAVAFYLIDRELDRYVEKQEPGNGTVYKVLHMWDANNGMVDKWRKFVERQMRNNYHPLDENIIFSNYPTTRESYASMKLTYPIEDGPTPYYDELVSVLYSEEERKKIEWIIGAIISGDSKNIQKFAVMYGAPGTGKSTILNIIQAMFTCDKKTDKKYWSAFESSVLGSANAQFAMESFKDNPLIAIQHEGNLSKIEDNTRLNSLVSHETMPVNLKNKSVFDCRFNSFLIMGTNKPVRITDAKSGIIRRLIDITPTGNKIPRKRYIELMGPDNEELTGLIKFELGKIAKHCLDVYKSDPRYYDDYIPTAMMGATNDFYNYVLDSYQVFKSEEYITLKRAWEMYKAYTDEARVPYPLSQRLFKEELKNYFEVFEEQPEDINYKQVYRHFIADKFETKKKKKEPKEDLANDILKASWLVLTDAITSLFDTSFGDLPAQYAQNDKPVMSWDECTMTLKDIDTSKTHYVRLPENHIVIDFDMKDETGKKSFELNAEAAAKWPPTYAELSKSGQGIHLHYIYTGDASKLSRIYADDIEIKVFTGKSSLRRKLTKCNDISIATISSGLPLKEPRTRMVNFDGIKNERALRTCIVKNLQKKNVPGTKPSIDFIFNDLESAYNSGIQYDVSDMKPDILAFASNSTNHASYCIRKVGQMKFMSKENIEQNMQVAGELLKKYGSELLVFFDVEVFPNLFIVVYKYLDGEPVKLINPTPAEIEPLLHLKLVGFNCRRYDNHIIYARYIGYSNAQLYELSQRIISGSNNGFFREAYNLSYTDVYDFSSVKQSLKKFEIELGLKHQECGLRWDEPVPEDKWEMVADYCVNDVIATEAVFKARSSDWTARQILVDICKATGMDATVNDTTNSLTTKIIFGNEKKPKLVYTDLATGKQY